MATPAAAGRASDISTTEENILALPLGTKGATSVKVISESGNGSALMVNIPPIHGTDFAYLNAGEADTFRSSNQGIKEVNVKSESGTLSIRWHINAMT